MKSREELLEDVAVYAGMICLETPAPKFPQQPTAGVRRALIRELEAALVAVGYDMDRARRTMREHQKMKKLEG